MPVPTNDRVYLDANFLISYLVPYHKENSGAGKLFASLLISGNTLNFSPLSLDETFNGIVIEARKKKKQISLPHATFYKDLKTAVDFLLNHHQLKLCQFENNPTESCLQAVKNIKDFTLQPRDAFHVAYMQDLGINYIVSGDSKFDRLSQIKIGRIGY